MRMAPGRTPRTRNGKLVAIAMLVLWLAILVAVYVVIVRLKMGGKEGIQLQPETPAETTTAAADHPAPSTVSTIAPTNE